MKGYKTARKKGMKQLVLSRHLYIQQAMTQAQFQSFKPYDEEVRWSCLRGGRNRHPRRSGSSSCASHRWECSTIKIEQVKLEPLKTVKRERIVAQFLEPPSLDQARRRIEYTLNTIWQLSKVESHVKRYTELLSCWENRIWTCALPWTARGSWMRIWSWAPP